MPEDLFSSQEDQKTELYPEHQKLRAISGESQKIGAFIEWMREQGVEFCKLRDEDDESSVPIASGRYWLDELMAVIKGNQDLIPHEFYAMPLERILAQYFEIDLDILEQEKRHMLAAMRQLNEQAG